jgi:hypothetical protein
VDADALDTVIGAFLRAVHLLAAILHDMPAVRVGVGSGCG